MSEKKTSSQSVLTKLVSKEVHIQGGYTPPPMATIQVTQPISDEQRGYTPPPMPTVLLRPEAPAGSPPASSQPGSSQPPASPPPADGLKGS